jgi:hypothetical protein
MTGFRTITSYLAAKESAVDSFEIPSLRSSTLKEQIDECLLPIKKKTVISPNQRVEKRNTAISKYNYIRLIAIQQFMAKWKENLR